MHDLIDFYFLKNDIHFNKVMPAQGSEKKLINYKFSYFTFCLIF